MGSIPPKFKAIIFFSFHMLSILKKTLNIVRNYDFVGLYYIILKRFSHFIKITWFMAEVACMLFKLLKHDWSAQK